MGARTAAAMKLALHRSITFWSGLLMMVFVCWAWRDSMRSRSTAWTNSGGNLNITNGYAGITLRKGGFSTSPPQGFARSGIRSGGGDWVMFDAFPRLHLVNADSLPEAQHRELLYTYLDDQAGTITLRDFLLVTSFRGYALHLPHWLILLTVAAVWLLLLFMRARRRNKIKQ